MQQSAKDIGEWANYLANVFIFVSILRCRMQSLVREEPISLVAPEKERKELGQAKISTQQEPKKPC